MRLDSHTATIRAIAWCPRDRRRIATGGGMQDRHIKVWDIEKGETFFDVNVGSQVCNLAWCSDHNELVSTEGFVDCTISVWNESEMKITAKIMGHHDRVLFSAMAPHDYCIATLTKHDGLKIWSLTGGKSADKPAALVR
jgi:WD40 repeat protein